MAWASKATLRDLGNRACFPRAPELCVEILSPGEADAAMQEKVALFFDAGAVEVWRCDLAGEMRYLAAACGQPLERSRLCPAFPPQIEPH